MDKGSCRSCGAAVIWCINWYGRRQILDADPDPAGNVIMVAEGRCRTLTRAQLDWVHGDWCGDHEPTYIDHHATCPHAALWKR